jgi:hypothetical protein
LPSTPPGSIRGPDDLESEEPHLKQLFHLAMLAVSLSMAEVETDILLVAVDAFVEDYSPLLPRMAPAA